jgi:hypothetical protein
MKKKKVKNLKFPPFMSKLAKMDVFVICTRRAYFSSHFYVLVNEVLKEIHFRGMQHSVIM